MAEADPKITETKVSVAELRANLSAYLKKVSEGASFVVVSRGKRVAVLKPEGEPPKLPPRVFGQMKGQIWISDDFDDPLPDEILDAFYAKKFTNEV